MALPDDYLERVYAGILGKLIGVYLGRPFEGWTYERIMREIGPIEYYVHERFGDPLVVTDDDIAGTFTFIRALDDSGQSEDITSEDIGKAWLNYIVEKRSILWWGGNGISTEHTAWLNLKRGIRAPASGSIQENGQTIAEQIGAQIFIDGWALVAPGRPSLAAKLAREAGRVSHDGEAVHAASLWAAMEAEAFVSSDMNHLIDTGLSELPGDCLIASLVADIRRWRREFADWRDTRKKIAMHYGYDRFPGNCHVVPNHALMIMAVLYAPDDFQLAQMIVNTSGWDTDCNAGNVGCLHGIMLGLKGLEEGPDWRGPVADRMLISSADGGNSVNDAVRTAYFVANLGRAVNGKEPLAAPKGGAQFHFSLPGSTQGFQVADGTDPDCEASVKGVERNGTNVLAVGYENLRKGGSVVATTPTFSPRDVLKMRTYELMACPLVYPGQRLSASVRVPAGNVGDVLVRLRLRRYGEADSLLDVDGKDSALVPGDATQIEWTIPDCGSQPIAEVGVVVTNGGQASRGEVQVDRIEWRGAPNLVLRRPEEQGEFWRRAWVNACDDFSSDFATSFLVSQDRGDGMIIHGTRQWTDYQVKSDIVVHRGCYAGLTVRTQGLRRYYLARVHREDRFEIVRVRDDERIVLASADFRLALGESVSMTVTVRGEAISASAGGVKLFATDASAEGLASGGVGLLVFEGAVSTDEIRVTPSG